jgi:hypothetical protein
VSVTRPTEEDKRRAVVLAERMKLLMDKNFLNEPSQVIHVELKNIRNELSEMGFHVTTQWNLHPDSYTLDTVITLWLPKKITPENVN